MLGGGEYNRMTRGVAKTNAQPFIAQTVVNSEFDVFG
jgi:hypothetical protein